MTPPLTPPPLQILSVVAVALVDGDGRVLLQRRPEGKAMAGLWEFPGGKMEPGERPEAALVRELKEELGIDVHASCLAPATFASADIGAGTAGGAGESTGEQRRHMLLLLYVCRKWQGQPAPLEASALKWVRPVEMYALDMPPADLPLIGVLEALI